jgi:hypothetical protein
MKKSILTLTTLFLLLSYTYSQEPIYKPFRVDVGTTLDIPTDDNASTGFGVYVEPRYAVNDKLVFGIRLEGIFLSAGQISVNTTSVDIKYTIISPILFTGEYFFNTQKVRPFIGLGIGMYKKTLGDVSTSVGNVSIGSKTKTNFGFAPKVGINSGHFRFAVIYNYTGTDISDFLGIQAGFEFGGGLNK